MKQPVKAKPVLTLAQAKKQISVLKGKNTKLENELVIERADRVSAVQSHRLAYEAYQKEQQARREQYATLSASYDYLSDMNKELANKYHAQENELKSMHLVSDNWKKNYLELQEERMNTPWNRLKTWVNSF